MPRRWIQRVLRGVGIARQGIGLIRDLGYLRRAAGFSGNSSRSLARAYNYSTYIRRKARRAARNRARWRRYRARRRRMNRKYKIRSRYYKAGGQIFARPNSGYRFNGRRWRRKFYRKWKYGKKPRTPAWLLKGMSNAKTGNVGKGVVPLMDIWATMTYPKIPTYFASNSVTLPTTYNEFVSNQIRQTALARIYRWYGKISFQLTWASTVDVPEKSIYCVRLIIMKNKGETGETPSEIWTRLTKNSTEIDAGYEYGSLRTLYAETSYRIIIDKLFRLTKENDYSAVYKYSIPTVQGNDISLNSNNWEIWQKSRPFDHLRFYVYLGVPSYVQIQASKTLTLNTAFECKCYPRIRFIPIYTGSQAVQPFNAIAAQTTEEAPTSSSSSSSSTTEDNESKEEPITEEKPTVVD